MRDDDKQMEQAIKYITAGAAMMGWSILLPDNPVTGHMIIGGKSDLLRLQLELKASYEWVVKDYK